MIKKYFSFINNNYVGDPDWDTITPIGKLFLLPVWYVRMFYINTFAIVCFPITIFHMKFETEISELIVLAEETRQEMFSDIDNIFKKHY